MNMHPRTVTEHYLKNKHYGFWENLGLKFYLIVKGMMKSLFIDLGDLVTCFGGAGIYMYMFAPPTKVLSPKRFQVPSFFMLSVHSIYSKYLN